jgi:hypothetical protein
MLSFMSTAFGQEINRVVFDERAQKEVLKGYCDREGLQSTVWVDLFEQEYTLYQPKMDLIFYFAAKLRETEIVITLGTWCGDSKEHVPAFFKILDVAGYDYAKLSMIALDRNFDSGEAGIRPYDTEKVPTFIFYSGGVELGRIIETPEESLEQHMLTIFGH